MKEEEKNELKENKEDMLADAEVRHDERMD